ncbi:hypothetical protein CLV41_12058 [Roseibium marinum]|uniref:Uncharacterized protein n=1 Tax=Roseibium marinum TaxID=281252 RepID=A0A2S3UJK4_9HYPH|nr:hypothetical protein CLV41_12058 [Roseibium marinum]
MGFYQPISKTRIAARCGAAGQIRNAGDGLTKPTEGSFFTPAGQRCGQLVARQATALTAPCRQTRKTGQAAPYSFKVL